MTIKTSKLGVQLTPFEFKTRNHIIKTSNRPKKIQLNTFIYTIVIS